MCVYSQFPINTILNDSIPEEEDMTMSYSGLENGDEFSRVIDGSDCVDSQSEPNPPNLLTAVRGHDIVREAPSMVHSHAQSTPNMVTVHLPLSPPRHLRMGIVHDYIHINVNLSLFVYVSCVNTNSLAELSDDEFEATLGKLPEADRALFNSVFPHSPFVDHHKTSGISIPKSHVLSRMVPLDNSKVSLSPGYDAHHKALNMSVAEATRVPPPHYALNTNTNVNHVYISVESYQPIMCLFDN